MQIAILIVVALIVIVLVVLGIIRARRSRSARSDWLGELSEIRRSSLGDDEEVTGVIEAVSVIAEPESAPPPAVASTSLTDAPTREVRDAGTVFNEYAWPDFALLRVDVTEPHGLRVIADMSDPAGGTDPEAQRPDQVMVDLPRGLAWFRSEPPGVARNCTVRTPAAWVAVRGVALVVASDDDWCYAMCVDGEVTVRRHSGGERVTVGAGGIARFQLDHDTVEVIDVGIAALESEGVLRRQRRLDASTMPEESPV